MEADSSHAARPKVNKAIARSIVIRLRVICLLLLVEKSPTYALAQGLSKLYFIFLLIYHDTSTILVKRQADFNLSEMCRFLPKLGQHRRYRRENPLARHICCNIWAILDSAIAIDGYKFNINANFLVPLSWVVGVGYKG